MRTQWPVRRANASGNLNNFTTNGMNIFGWPQKKFNLSSLPHLLRTKGTRSSVWWPPHGSKRIKICGILVLWAMWTNIQFSSVQSLSCVRLFATPWIAARQASLSITNSQSSPKLTCIESVMPSSRLILCCPLFLLPQIPPSIRVFSNESILCMRWPKYWSFSLSISPSNEHPGVVYFRMDWLDLLQSKGLSRVFSSTTVQKHQFFGAQLSSQSNSHIHTWPLEKP